MPKYKVFIAMSLDGFIAGPNNELDWLMANSSPEEDYGYDNFINSIDALLMGYNTYEVVSKFAEWPYKKPVIVISSMKFDTPNAELFNDDITKLDEFLQTKNYQNIYVDGGQTISRLLNADKIESMIITIIPIILGNGIKLFSNIDYPINLKLIECRSFNSGLIQLKYLK